MLSALRSRRASLLLIGTGLFLAATFLTHLAWQSLTPDFTAVRLSDDSGELGDFPLPFRWPTRSASIDVQLEMVLPRLHPGLYDFDFRGCLEEFSVNGRSLQELGLPACASGARGGDRFDLRSHLRPGRNTLELRMRRPFVGGLFTVHTLNVRPSTNDPLVIALTTVFVVLVGAYGLFLARRLPLARKEVVVVLVGGVVFRALYVIGTGVSVRSYDWYGHFVYISYLAENLTIPSAQTGWQTYQPPLYYAFCAAWVHLGSLLGRSSGRLFNEDLQTFSFLLSVAALAVGVWVGTRLFPSRRQWRELLLYGGALAVLPGVVFFSSRISNDVLYHFFAFLFLGLLLRFWQRGQERDWWLLSVVMGLALLTKSNSLLLIPIAYGCLVLKDGIAARKKAALLAASVLLVVAMVGWLWVLRFVMEGEQSIVGNMYRFDPSLRIERSPEDFLVFNPIEIIRHPFVDDRIEASRPELFWEYLFRSAHFGAFRLATDGFIAGIAVVLLAVSTLLLAPMGLGLWRDLRLGSRTLPLWLTTITLLGGHLAYRMKYPFSFNQDFRFSVLLVIPLSYYATVGIQQLRGRLRIGAALLMLLFIALSAALLVALHGES